jgi:hypothetical protein
LPFPTPSHLRTNPLFLTQKTTRLKGLARRAGFLDGEFRRVREALDGEFRRASRAFGGYGKDGNKSQSAPELSQFLFRGHIPLFSVFFLSRLR